MPGFLGADTGELRGQGRLTAQGTRTLQESLEQASRRVDSVTWFGPDADAFRERWHAEAMALVHDACERLDAMARDLDSQAEEQDAASDSDGDGTVWGGVDDALRNLADLGNIGAIPAASLFGPGGPLGPGSPLRPGPVDHGAPPVETGHYAGDPHYRDRGRVAGADDPPGAHTSSGTAWDGREQDKSYGYSDGYGRTSKSSGGSFGSDGNGFVVAKTGAQAGSEIGYDVEAYGPFGGGIDSSGRVGAESYAEAGWSSRLNHGYSTGARLGADVYGDVDAQVTGPAGMMQGGRLSGALAAEAHANLYSGEVRNESGQVNGWSAGAEAGAFAGAIGTATYEARSPGGWFDASITGAAALGGGASAGGGVTVSSDEVSAHVSGKAASFLGLGAGASVGVHPNAIVNTFTPGDYDIDDLVDYAMKNPDTVRDNVPGAEKDPWWNLH